MATLVEINKRGPRLTPEQKAEQKRQRTQARVGLGSNVLGLTAGTVATAGALRDPRLAGGGKISRGLHAVGNKIPKPITNLSDKWVTTAPKKAALLAGGALALQAGNMGGDVVANRVLARSAQQGQKPVKKSAGKVAGAAAATSAAGAAGAATLKKIGEGARAGVQAEKKKRSWLVPAAVVGSATAGGGGALVLSRRRNKDVEKADGEYMLDAYISKADHTAGHGSIEKAYRRYDPEADRQRRLGLASGAGVGGAAVLGSMAAKKYTTKLAHDGNKAIGIAVKPKHGKGAVLLTGGALASGGLGAAAYRRGLSERNNPWN